MKKVRTQATTRDDPRIRNSTVSVDIFTPLAMNVCTIIRATILVTTTAHSTACYRDSTTRQSRFFDISGHSSVCVRGQAQDIFPYAPAGKALKR